jgi:hypothetical protein
MKALKHIAVTAAAIGFAEGILSCKQMIGADAGTE